ncbi:site-specific integrase [Massilia sp. WG5]|uniref:tyrosine-type recombinase/integrase n=1 Tax=Massilia sp. WG5 TaxID=1707785 RepID=UPI0009E7855B|nr:site-specific integrase [Massilia sp. WG5]
MPYRIEYTRTNPRTKREQTVVKFRGQLRYNGKTYSKLFETESLALDWEEQKSKELSGVSAITALIEETNQVDMRQLLQAHYSKKLSKQSETSRKSNENRCLKQIPSVKIPYKAIQHRINNYKYSKTIVKAMLDCEFDYVNDGIRFGDFFASTVDFYIIKAYIEVRKDHGIANNTLLRELTTISGAFTNAYDYFKQFENGIQNPVKLLPKGIKPKPQNDRKTVLSDDDIGKIAQFLSLKTNLEPYWCFIQCIYSGVRRVECLRMEWENIDWKKQLVHLTEKQTKNGRAREVPLHDEFFNYLKEHRKASGKIFKLTYYNMRAYWVDALKQNDLYDNPRTRPIWNDTRRTAITTNLRRSEGNTFQLAKVFGVKPSEIEKEQKKIGSDIQDIIKKLQNGEPLTPKEISLLSGHQNSDITHQTYNADR